MNKINFTFDDWIQRIKNIWIDSPWVTVYCYSPSDKNKIGIYATFITKEYTSTALLKPSWDFMIGDGYPGHYFATDGSAPEYYRYDKKEVVPLLISRDFHGMKPSYYELSEEFRHYLNLYHDVPNSQYLRYDDEGNEEIVARYKNDLFEIQIKPLLEFLDATGYCLLFQFDHLRRSNESLKDLGLEETHGQFSGEDHICALDISDGHSMMSSKSIARLMGKKIINPPRKYIPELFPTHNSDDYQNFIIAMDRNGEPIRHSCDPEVLDNYFDKNPGAPHYLTPVFFRKDVLQKYYTHPEKYSVEDGLVRCSGLWILRIDNNNSDYVIAFLGDLGRDIGKKEREYWLSFNIPPSGSISSTAFQRGFMAQFTDPEQVDLLFKQKYSIFTEKWTKERGWSLFKPLSENDQHCFVTLRIPLNDSVAEIDAQVLSLTKILIDSINEKEISKEITVEKDDKGITKLKKYFEAKGLVNATAHIEFLRNLQSLRAGSGHRKGDAYKNASKHFELDTKGYRSGFEAILEKSLELLQCLSNELLN